MDFKSTIFIFGVALIFVLPLAISSPISGARGVCWDNPYNESMINSGCDDAHEYCDMKEDRCVTFTGYQHQRHKDCPSTEQDSLAYHSTLSESIQYCNSHSNCHCIDISTADPKFYRSTTLDPELVAYELIGETYWAYSTRWVKEL